MSQSGRKTGCEGFFFGKGMQFQRQLEANGKPALSMKFANCNGVLEQENGQNDSRLRKNRLKNLPIQ